MSFVDDGAGLLGLGLVVLDEQLDLLAEDAALRVDARRTPARIAFRVEMPKVAIPPVSEPYSPIEDLLAGRSSSRRTASRPESRPDRPRQALETSCPDLLVSGLRKTAYCFAEGHEKSKHPFGQWLRLESGRSRNEREARTPLATAAIPRAETRGLQTRARRAPLPASGHAAEHPISRAQIDPDALKVLYRLRGRRDTRRYLVGGSVRDLLLGRRAQGLRHRDRRASRRRCGKLFRNCRLIGRRFRLAHILFANGKVVEVATFRRRPDPAVDGERRRAAPDLRQHVRHAARGRAAPRLHDQRPLLRHRRLLGHRLRRRPRRPRGGPRPHDRRSRRPLPGGPGAHDARRRVRQPPRLRDHARRVRGDPAAPEGDREVGAAARDRGARPGAARRPRPADAPAPCARSACSTRSCPSSPRCCARSIPTTPAGPGTSSGRCSTCSTRSAGAAASFEDAVLFALLFLPIVRARVRADRAGRRAGPEPPRDGHRGRRVAARLSGCRCPRAVDGPASSRRLSIVGKLSHRPDAKVATRRLAFRDSFPTALDLFELTAMATGRGQELVARVARGPGPDRARRARPARSRRLRLRPATPPPGRTRTSARAA